MFYIGETIWICVSSGGFWDLYVSEQGWVYGGTTYGTRATHLLTQLESSVRAQRPGRPQLCGQSYFSHFLWCDSVTVWQLCDSDNSEICVTIWWKWWWQSERGSFGDLEVAQQAKPKDAPKISLPTNFQIGKLPYFTLQSALWALILSCRWSKS